MKMFNWNACDYKFCATLLFKAFDLRLEKKKKNLQEKILFALYSRNVTLVN